MNIKSLCTKHNIRIDNQWADNNPNMTDSQNMNHFKCTLKMHGRQMTLYFSQGYGINGDPKSEDVINCLVSDSMMIENSRSFEDWCSELGYDSDSRKAEQFFKVCEKQAEKFKVFMGDVYEEAIESEML